MWGATIRNRRFFFGRMNCISNLTAQIKLLYNFDPEELVFKVLSGLFLYSYWLLCSLSSRFPHNYFLGWYLLSPRTKFLSARTYFASNYLTVTRDRPLMPFCWTAILISTIFFSTLKQPQHAAVNGFWSSARSEDCLDTSRV